MGHNSPSRWLAPIALLAFAAAILIVLSSGGGGGGSDAGDDTRAGVTAATTSDATTTGASTTETTPSKRRYYRVMPGDTLSLIADRTGVALEVIEELNPGLDAQTLQTGQRIKLRP